MGVRERYFNVYRLAAYFLVLFTIGHTLGTVIRTPEFGLQSDAVLAAMKSVHFDTQGAHRTWYEFYRGMSASVSLSMIFQVAMTWYLGGKSAQERRALVPLTWALFVTLAAGVINAWLFFFPAAVGFSIIVAALVGIGCINDSRRRAAQ